MIENKLTNSTAGEYTIMISFIPVKLFPRRVVNTQPGIEKTTITAMVDKKRLALLKVRVILALALVFTWFATRANKTGEMLLEMISTASIKETEEEYMPTLALSGNK